MAGKIKSLSIRIDEEMLNKLHVVADYEGRSANSEILILIRDAIAAYEKTKRQNRIVISTHKMKGHPLWVVFFYGL